LKVIILSEEAVGEKELRQKLIEQLERKNSIAGTTLLMFTREKIEEIIKKCSESGVSCGEYLEMMEANRKKKEQQKKTLAAVLRDYSEGKRRIGVTILRKDEEIKIWDGIMNIKEETEFQIYYDSVLRFHIRANSDSEKDQVVKNLIKDEVLVKIQNILKGCDTKDSCVTTIKGKHKIITAWVSEACEKYQNVYKGEVYLVREAFPLKVYGDSVVPSGIYDALRIDLGKGEGANWWCMMYPELCLSDGVIEEIAKEEEKTENNNSENSVINKGKRKYRIRWRIMELLREVWKN
jgi:stage II sporulation protein R